MNTHLPKTVRKIYDDLNHRHDRRLILESGLFDAEWYTLANPYIVRDGIDAAAHFLQCGRNYRLSPSRAFDAIRYLEQHESVKASRLNPLIHYLRRGRKTGLEIHPAPPSEADRISASGMFDAEWYLAQHPDVAAADYPPLLHYMVYGALEGRSPGPNFDGEWYLTRYPDIVGMNPLLHYIDYGRAEGRLPVRPWQIIEAVKNTIAGAEDLDPDLYGTDHFENLDRLEIVNGIRRNRLAVCFDKIVEQLDAMPQAVVFLPWLIHGGADLEAGHMVRALVEIHGSNAVLIVLTDHDREEAPHLVPEGVPVVSFSRIDGALSHTERVDLVDLLIRNLHPEVVLNVNSYAWWEAVKRNGRKLARFTRLYTMLFCPDFSPSGRRSGYSDLYLRHCLPFLSGVYFDNKAYIEEVTRQFGIPAELRSRLVTVYQPAPPLVTAPASIRNAEDPLRVLWAGRLAAQKNVDLLMKIAERAPRFEFHIWGRGDEVLKAQLDQLALRCNNVHFHGPFERFDALPTSTYDAFLYTSRWDGIPNVLLEAGAAGLPIVASHVGGIGELVDDETGWLIPELENPEPYISALQAIADSPAEATERVQALLERLRSNHSWQPYRKVLACKPIASGGLLRARPRITAVLNAHREGMLAKPSLESLKRAVERAEAAGVTVETIAVLDRPDPLTHEIVESHAPKGALLIETEFGDVGKARNHAVRIARGDYVSVLDADDLWGVDWLEKALKIAETRLDPVVWHPEVNVYFGAERHIFQHIDMEDGAFRPSSLMIENCWTALSFASRDIYLENPYPDSDLEAGFGFEDWSWHMQTISRGILHKVVPGTGHVIRRKVQSSLAKATVAAQAIPIPNTYLKNYLELRQRGDLPA